MHFMGSYLKAPRQTLVPTPLTQHHLWVGVVASCEGLSDARSMGRVGT